MAKSAIRQHLDHLRALDKEFRRFEKKMRSTIRKEKGLKALGTDLDRLKRALIRPAFGLQ